MIIGIIRGATRENIETVIEAGYSAGIHDIEITLNTPDAIDLIRIASKKWEVGAGTVLTQHDAKSAIDAGAKFIVSPIADPQTIKYCKTYNIPIYPAGLTPNEVYQAWKLGATMVKVFPVKSMGGPEYIKELKGPFDEIKLLACGGVTPQNIKDYYAAGVSAVAVGNSVFNKKLMDEGNYAEISRRAKELVTANKQALSSS